MASTQPQPYTGTTTTPEKPKKKRRIFVWFFLAVQLLMIVWIISGAMSANGQPTDCGSLSADTCNTASDAGTAIGVIGLVALWMVLDFLLGVGYAVYRLATRP